MNYSNLMVKTGQYLGEWIERHLILLIFFAVALAVRIYVYLHTAVINPEGPLYIFQARALFSREWETLTGCGLNYLSFYPLLIYAAHLVIDNWDTAARLVSLIFGMLLLVPTYLLLREFFSKAVCQCTTLAFGLLPIMVAASVDVVRDPIAWFFLITGQWLVVLALRLGRRPFLILALAAFALATWARLEAFVYIPATAVALPMLSRREGWRNLAWFSGPLLAVVVLILILSMAGGGLGDLHRIREILQRADLLDTYEKLRAGLGKILLNHQTYTPGNFFLLEAKRFAWLVAGAGVLTRLVEAFSCGFFLLFLLGLKRFRRRFPAAGLRLYFPLLCGFSFLLLYALMIHGWSMEYRHTVLIIIGGLVIFGTGLEWLLDLLGRYLKPAGGVLVMVTGGVLFLAVFQKNFQDRAVSEVVLKEIGLIAAALSPGPEPVLIMASHENIRLLTHFANSHQSVPQCPEPEFSIYEALPRGGPGELADYLRANRIGFLLWEENNRLTDAGLLRENITPEFFSEIGRWDSQKGRMTLYRMQ